RQMVRNELLEREGYGPVPTQIGDWRDFSLGHNAAYASLLPIMDKLKDSRALSYTLDDFSSLKQGMSYREIVRQFGNPYNYSINALTRAASTRDVLMIAYRESSENRYVYLYIDTASGLTKVCLNTDSSYCQSVLK